MCKVHVRLTTSMIPHYQNDENNVPGKSKFNNINDTPLPKRRNNVQGTSKLNNINVTPLPKRRK